MMGTMAKLLKSVGLVSYFVDKIAFKPPKKSSYEVSSGATLVIKTNPRALVDRNIKTYCEWVTYCKAVPSDHGCHVVNEDQRYLVCLSIISPEDQPSAAAINRQWIRERVNRQDGVVLYSHGTTIDAGGTTVFCNQLLRQAKQLSPRVNLGFVTWDYPGYGLSKGKPSEEATLGGISAVYDWVVNDMGVNPERLIIVGNSMGSVPTSHLAHNWRATPVRGVVLISPMQSAFTIISNKTEYDSKDPVGKMSTIKPLRDGCPWRVLIAHGEKDEIVPVQCSKNVVEALTKTPKDREVLQFHRFTTNEDSQERTDTQIDMLAAFLSGATGADSRDQSCRKFQPPSLPTDLPSYPSQLAPKWGSRVTYLLIDGADHNSVIKSPKFQRSLHQFLAALLVECDPIAGPSCKLVEGQCLNRVTKKKVCRDYP